MSWTSVREQFFIPLARIVSLARIMSTTGITEIRNTDTCQANAYDAPGLHFLIPFSVICQRVKALQRGYTKIIDIKTDGKLMKK
jgi:regulator of protease activity HflC (stomatin/prohibitin superfamily)